jgi:hypothetical protein
MNRAEVFVRARRIEPVRELLIGVDWCRAGQETGRALEIFRE